MHETCASSAVYAIDDDYDDAARRRNDRFVAATDE